MTGDTLFIGPRMLLVFIDETGIENYSDPKNPTFGRGGCAVLAGDYKKLIKKPWRKLKRERLGGAMKPVHAAEFERSRPTKVQITAINRFLERPFWRFAVMSDKRTELPPGIDGHKAVSLVTVKFVTRLVADYDPTRGASATEIRPPRIAQTTFAFRLRVHLPVSGDGRELSVSSSPSGPTTALLWLPPSISVFPS